MENRTNWSRLARYLAGKCSPDEERELEAWVRADPTRAQLLDELRRIWDAAEDPATDWSDPSLDMDAEWQNMQEKLRSADRSASERPRSREKRTHARSSEKGRSSWSRAVKWGARTVGAILLLAGGLWLAQSNWFSTTAPEETATYQEVVTEPGEQSQIQLTDGSSVMLNVDSKLRSPEAFSKQKRVVYLRGEAYFEVEADPNRPFVVETDEASVEVLGTSFNVRDYPEEEQIQVAVTEGGVSVHAQSTESEEQGTNLVSGQVGRWMAPDTALVTEMRDVTPFIAWTEGRMVFENTPLSTVALRLERWYDVEVKIQDSSLRSLRLTASLKSESVRNVLDVISASLGLTYRMQKDTVFLMSRERSR